MWNLKIDLCGIIKSVTSQELILRLGLIFFRGKAVTIESAKKKKGIQGLPIFKRYFLLGI